MDIKWCFYSSFMIFYLGISTVYAQPCQAPSRKNHVISSEERLLCFAELLEGLTISDVLSVEQPLKITGRRFPPILGNSVKLEQVQLRNDTYRVDFKLSTTHASFTKWPNATLEQKFNEKDRIKEIVQAFGLRNVFQRLYNTNLIKELSKNGKVLCSLSFDMILESKPAITIEFRAYKKPNKNGPGSQLDWTFWIRDKKVFGKELFGGQLIGSDGVLRPIVHSDGVVPGFPVPLNEWLSKQQKEYLD